MFDRLIAVACTGFGPPEGFSDGEPAFSGGGDGDGDGDCGGDSGDCGN